MMLSIFKGYADTMPVAVSLDEVVRLIREDKVLAKIPLLPLAGAEDGRQPGKVGLPLLFRSGAFRRGQAKNRHQRLDRSLDGGL